MNKPWEIRNDDIRLSDTTTLFIIFCEDKVSEPLYFESFGGANVRVQTIKNCGQHHRQVEFATNKLRNDGLLKVVDEREVIKSEDLIVGNGVQIWCVFDRDRNHLLDDGKSSAFNDSIAVAKDRGIRVAWSNDNFELWILWHFEDVELNNLAYVNREYYYQRLEMILKKEYESLADDDKGVLNPMFTYDSSIKKGKQFGKVVLPLLGGRLSAAIQRAETLENHFAVQSLTPNSKAPCTTVHHLVKELTSLRGKSE